MSVGNYAKTKGKYSFDETLLCSNNIKVIAYNLKNEKTVNSVLQDNVSMAKWSVNTGE